MRPPVQLVCYAFFICIVEFRVISSHFEPKKKKKEPWPATEMATPRGQRGHQSVSRPDQNVVPMMGEGVSVSLLTLAGRALASSAVPLGKVTGEGMVPECWENGMAHTYNIYIYMSNSIPSCDALHTGFCNIVFICLRLFIFIIYFRFYFPCSLIYWIPVPGSSIVLSRFGLGASPSLYIYGIIFTFMI